MSEQGLILETHLTAAGLLDVERSRPVKQRVTRFVVRDDRDIYYLHRKQFFETRSASSLRPSSVQAGQAGASQMYELRLMKKDGAQFWAQLRATTAQDADGASVCRAVVSDITDRKRAEVAAFKELTRIRPDVRVILSSGYDHQDTRKRGLPPEVRKRASLAKYVRF